MLYGDEQVALERIQQQNTEEQVEQSLFQGQRAKFFEEVVSDHNLPDEAQDLFEAFFDPEFALTFLKDSEVHQLMMEFDNTTLQHLMTKFPHELDDDAHRNLTQLRARLRAKMLRSRGKGRDNERKMWVTNINQQIAEYEDGRSSGGILGKVKRGFGGK